MKQHNRSTHRRFDDDQGSSDSRKLAEDFRQLSVVDIQVRLLQKLVQAIAAELVSGQCRASGSQYPTLPNVST
jgi:hypothetical protein